MSNLREILNTWDNADSELNKKIDNTNLSTIVASATASAMNSKTVEINGTGKNVEKLEIEGKTVQDGTPSPTNPVEVKGVGDKVVNLLNVGLSKKDTRLTWVTGQEMSATGFSCSDFIAVEAKTYVTNIYVYIAGYDKDKNFVGFWDGSTFVKESVASAYIKSVTIPSDVKYIKLTNSQINQYFNSNTMFTDDSSTDVFIPYGSPKYKIPISVGGTTKNVYLDTPLFNGEKADVVSGVAYNSDGSTKETFEAPEIPTVIGKNTLSVDTEIVPTSIEAVTFGDYYSKVEVDKMFGEWVETTVRFTNTASNTLEYTGFSIKVPNGKRLMISIKNIYGNSAPEKTVISDSDSDATGRHVISEGVSYCSALITPYGTDDITISIWSAHAAANANIVAIAYKFI